MTVCHPESLAAVVNCCKYSSKTLSPAKASGNKHDVTAAKTAPAAAVDILGAAGERRVKDTKPGLPDPHPCSTPPPLFGDAVLGPSVEDAILSTKPSLLLLKITLEFNSNARCLRNFFNQLFLYVGGLFRFTFWRFNLLKTNRSEHEKFYRLVT